MNDRAQKQPENRIDINTLSPQAQAWIADMKADLKDFKNDFVKTLIAGLIVQAAVVVTLIKCLCDTPGCT